MVEYMVSYRFDTYSGEELTEEQTQLMLKWIDKMSCTTNMTEYVQWVNLNNPLATIGRLKVTCIACDCFN